MLPIHIEHVSLPMIFKVKQTNDYSTYLVVEYII